MMRVDLIEQSAPPQPVYPSMQPMQTCVRLPYDYTQIYPQTQPVIPVPTLWRTL